MTKTKLISTVVVLAAAAVGGLLWSGRLGREQSNRLLISGNVELTQVDISFKVPGKLVDLRVDEGAAVARGMLLARIDREQTERQRSREQAGLVSSETQLSQLATGVEWQKETVAADIQLKQAELRASEAQLAELLAGSRSQDIQSSKAAVADAMTQHVQAAADWTRAQTLYKNDDISTSQFDQYRARNDSTAALLKQAEERLALVMEGPRKEEIETARAQVARAHAALKMSETNRLNIRQREEELLTHRAEIERAKTQVAIIDSQLTDTTALSPIDGVVLVKSAQVGEVLAAGAPVITVGDIDHPWLRGYIGERDLGRVKLGAVAKLTSDSYPGKTYTGQVSFISSEAEFTPKQIQTREERVKLVYRIKIQVENPKRELKSNMPVDAEIAVEQ